jgi:hypothetical protein
MDNKKEYIICSAIHFNDKKIHDHQPINVIEGFIVCGRRHHNCFTTFAQIVGFPYDDKSIEILQTEKQGFLTNTNRFVNRKEGGEIAFNSGQTDNLKITLYSEDLY